MPCGKSFFDHGNQAADRRVQTSKRKNAAVTEMLNCLGMKACIMIFVYAIDKRKTA
jgi:hypothetical protein